MSFNPARLALIACTAALLAACGRSEPVQPVEPPPAEIETPDPVPLEPGPDDGPEVHDDHDEDETAGGTPHVHGIADFALSREGDRYSGELVSPLANFGLSETDGTFTDEVTAELSGLVELAGGECTADVPHPMLDASGAHTEAVVHFSWTCAKPDAVTALRFAGFEAFGLFEKVSAVYITDTAQKAADLTPAAPELALK